MRISPGGLAVLGGEPAFREPVHVGRPNIGDRERVIALISDVLDRRWLTNSGPLVLELEERIARLHGVKHCMAMCNATVALEIAIRALDLSGEVIVPSYTFIATAHALQWQRITPVFCDIDERSHNIDPSRIEDLITARTTGIVGVHVWGRPCQTEALQQIADRNRLKLMFDAAHAFACSHKGKSIGGFGSAEVFSFHATKFYNTFEGGAVVTNDDDLAQKIRLMRNFGFSGYDNVVHVGTNGKMAEVNAAMGLAGLECLEAFASVNKRNYRLYRDSLNVSPGLQMAAYDESEQCNFQYCVLEVDPLSAALDRDELVRVLHAENILARKYFWPGCHRMEPYRSSPGGDEICLPVTERVAQRVIVLPTGTAMTVEDITRVCAVIRAALANAGEVRDALAKESFLQGATSGQQEVGHCDPPGKRQAQR